MSVHDFSVRTAEGDLRPLLGYAGRVLLIVNVASQRGLTPQYAELETLYRENKSHGLDVLGFPCNQFGGQEPSSDAEIQQFCSTSYQVSFPVFAKIDVNGPTADPLYRYLRTQAPGEFGPAHGVLFDHVARTRPQTIGTDEVKWKFTTFLIDRDGTVLRRYEPILTPAALAPELTPLLAG